MKILRNMLSVLLVVVMVVTTVYSAVAFDSAHDRDGKSRAGSSENLNYSRSSPP